MLLSCFNIISCKIDGGSLIVEEVCLLNPCWTFVNLQAYTFYANNFMDLGLYAYFGAFNGFELEFEQLQV